MARNKRKLALILIDITLINFAFLASFYLRFDFRFLPEYTGPYWASVPLVTVTNLLALWALGQYNKIWRYANLRDITTLAAVKTLGSLLSFVAILAAGIRLPRSIYLLSWITSVVLLMMSRIVYRLLVASQARPVKVPVLTNVLIIGAGGGGQMLIREMRTHGELGKRPVAILDDDRTKHRRSIEGVPVVGQLDDLPRVLQEKKIDEVIFAIPTAPRGVLKKIITVCSDAKVKIKTLPGLYELIDGKVMVKQIRDVNIDDLLGREPVKVDLPAICSYIQDKTVLVTGGGGSIGSELCRQIVKYAPEHLIILDIYENAMYEIQQELYRRYPGLRLSCVVADIRDEKRVAKVFARYRPDLVFHAAAHKHVPLMEDNACEAVKNNIYGTLNLVRYADLHHVGKFVLISTDKAVNPTSVMGATKRVCEQIVQAFNRSSATEFVAVRFGNVLGSNGSVIPLFKKQIEDGGPVTVTHEEVKRYFMTIPEAVQLVIQAGAMAEGGEIFVLDMGEPVKIINLARDLIRLSGFEPGVDIEIKVTGLRPGEKMFEELILADAKYTTTSHDKIMAEKPNGSDFDRVLLELERYKGRLNDMEPEEIKTFIKSIVPEYILPAREVREEVAVTRVN